MKQQVFNPFLPSWEYVPDGEPRVFGDRLYLYGSHDAFNGADFCVNNYVCWSTPLNYTGNTHGGMAEVNGQWYIFYHRQTNQTKCSRQACAEKLTILPDGSIPQAEVTSSGLNGGPLMGKGCYEARIACNLGAVGGMIKSDEAKKKDKKNLLPYFTQSGEDREANGNQYIENLRHGSWCAFKYFAFDGSESKLTITVRGSAAGTVKVCVNRNMPPVASVPVKPSGDWAEYTGELDIPSGEAPLTFVYDGSGSLDFAVFEIQ